MTTGVLNVRKEWRSVALNGSLTAQIHLHSCPCHIFEYDTCWHLLRHKHKLLSPHTNVKHPSSWVHARAPADRCINELPSPISTSERHVEFVVQWCPLVAIQEIVGGFLCFKNSKRFKLSLCYEWMRFKWTAKLGPSHYDRIDKHKSFIFLSSSFGVAKLC